MIRCDGRKVLIAGTSLDTIQDFVNITKTVRNYFVDAYGEEVADKIVMLCGREAYAKDGDESVLTEMAELLREISE